MRGRKLIRARARPEEPVRGGTPAQEVARGEARGAGARKSARGKTRGGGAWKAARSETRGGGARKPPEGEARVTRARKPTGEERRAPGESLSHFDARGAARMVDVGAKPETARTAVATAVVEMRPETAALVEAGKLGKGDVLAVARLAALMGLKRTAELIPLCHPVRVVGGDVDLAVDSARGRVVIRAEVRARDRTGVEMEALTAATVAALTVYDMCKAVDRGMRIVEVRLEEKRGGRSGVWRRPE